MRTLISIELSGLAKLSCTPPQHTGMSVEVSSVGGAVILGGTTYGRRTDTRQSHTKYTVFYLSMPHMCSHSLGTTTSADTGSLVPTAFTANALTVNLSPLVKFTLSWLTSNETCICSELGNE